jgi:transposase
LLSTAHLCYYVVIVSTTSNPSAASSSVPSDVELVEQLKQQLATTEQRLQYAELKIQVLEEQLRRRLIEKYGSGSEKLSTAQLELLELEPGVSSLEVQAESGREPLPARPKRAKHPGRQTLPPDLPRVERLIPCTAEQCMCGRCGQPMVVIGYEESEQLDVEPAKYFVLVTKREKRACKACAEGVLTAPLPPRIIEKGLASDRIVIDTIISKYSDHCPLYRQSAILEREMGLELSRATLDGWVMQVGERLIPVAAAMRRELLTGDYIQADETPVPVQMHDGRGKNHQAYLWQYGRPAGTVVFDFRLGRGRDGPKQFLGNFDGILQTDGYAAYEQVGGPQLVHAGCWSHARRAFFEAAQLNPQDAVAVAIVAQIDKLFAIDAQARREGLDQVGRHALRQQQAPPLLHSIKARIEAAQSTALPASALAKACRYTLALWHKLTRFLDYPELELSNNRAENSMRPVALGRKNWIHIGSAKAGAKVAAILSVAESCRRMKLSTRDYLGAVLPGLADLTIQCVAGLTPSAWAAQHQ